MAAMGPSKDFALIRAQAAYEDIMQLLKDKYDVVRPYTVNGRGFEKQMQDDWDAQAQQFKDILGELVWTSDASSF